MIGIARITTMIKTFYLRRKGIADKGSFISLSTILKGKNKIYRNAVVANSNIGYGTYIGGGSAIRSCLVGNYCSIGPRVLVVLGKHPTSDFVSTHPAFFSVRKQAGFTYVNENSFEELRFIDGEDGEEKYRVKIGNDVWIGADVKITDGVTIGDGAIVGMGAIVIKDVPAYAIAVGVPARVIKYRFTPEEISFLLRLQWWNKGEEWIKAHVKYFGDVKKLKDLIEGERDKAPI